MANSSGRKTTSKDAKPKRPKGCPLFLHRNGSWCKKVRGRFVYFGKDLDSAIKRWASEKDDLLAGREPRDRTEGGLTLRELVNRFLTFKENMVNSGELAPRSFQRYHASAERLIEHWGPRRRVDDLHPADFEKLRSVLSKIRGPISLGPEIQMIRTLFKYGYDSGLIDRPVRFGPGFKKPSAKTIRQARTASGPKLFEPAQVHAILQAATPNMRAMVLLGLNGGLGNTDLAEMPIDAVDLETGWLVYPRRKTAIFRKIPLWSETVHAMREAWEQRGTPDDKADAKLFFIGRRGESYVGGNRGYRIHQEARRVFASAKVTGRSFYDFRRTFQTIGEEAGDLTAVQAIMGHAPPSNDMSAIYRQRVSDDRLRRVVDHVHAWLFPTP